MAEGPAPTGTVTFLFTDIEGSTRRWEQAHGAMSAALRRHDEIVRRAVEGRAIEACRLLGAADSLRVEIGAPAPPSLQAELDTCCQRLRATLGDEAIERALSEGRSMPWEQVAEQVLVPVSQPEA